MMKKILLVISLFLVIFLSACGEDASIYNFKIRKDDYLVSESGNVLVEYKTNEEGKLVKLSIDRLLSIEDMIYFNPLINYDYVLEGFTGDIFTDAGYSCTKYDDFEVPINIEIGSTRFKYERIDCEYQEVDRNNIIKTGTYARRYALEDTLGFNQDTIISIVVYDENSIEKFIDIIDLPNSVKSIGVYSIGFNSDKDGFVSDLVNYYQEIAIYEQLFLKIQENELTIAEVTGFTEDINILDLSSLGDITPLIDDFVIDYEEEIIALDELEDLIEAISTEEVEPEDVTDDE
ncbi:MAG: hypothetical protein KQ78_00045 [Candidatus Izimaplasma bacterium HR2]|nr:MAG: hypothetical protein KQ78_00045 [Candidatus Izimaplasma bacterium HR2]